MSEAFTASRSVSFATNVRTGSGPDATPFTDGRTRSFTWIGALTALSRCRAGSAAITFTVNVEPMVTDAGTGIRTDRLTCFANA